MISFRVLVFINALVLGISVSSCKKYVEIDPPKNQIVTPQVFSDSANATAAILGLYIRMNNNVFSVMIGNGGLTLWAGLSADELNYAGGDPSQVEFGTNAISSNNDINSSRLWRQAYTIIYQANACLEGLDKSSGISVPYKNQLIGEAKFMRAFMFFYLTNLYGEVPLTMTTDYQINATLPRSSKSEIYEQVVADLVSAQQLLNEDYVTSGRIRPNKQTVNALLARVYLYERKWAEAESISSQIIGDAVYSLTSVDSVFLNGSKEAIWQLPYAAFPFGTAEAWQMGPFSSNSVPAYPITNFLANAFDQDDSRRSNWLGINTVGSDTFYYANKYKQKIDVTTPSQEGYIVFRLGEQYLIRAEARARQDNLTEALADINSIRARAGLPDILSTATQPQILDAIEHERQVELSFEWGHRWFDLKRTNRADAILGIEKPSGWQSTDTLYPIPLSEIELNPFLNQNPGYQ